MCDCDKVKAGLISCNSVEQDKACPVCPYKPMGNLCNMALMRDALAVIRANEPRLLALDEIHRGMSVWLEDIDKPDLLLAIGGSSCGGAKCFIGENDLSIAAKDSEYNVRWRAWTAEPTAEQRKVVLWDA